MELLLAIAKSLVALIFVLIAFALIYLSIASFRIKTSLELAEEIIRKKIPELYNLSATSLSALITVLAVTEPGPKIPFWLNALPKVKDKFGKYQVFVNPAKAITEGMFELSQILKNFKIK